MDPDPSDQAVFAQPGRLHGFPGRLAGHGPERSQTAQTSHFKTGNEKSEVGMAIATVNPATGKTVKTFEPFSAQRVDDCIANAVAAFDKHRRTSFASRAAAMNEAARILEDESDVLGRLMTLEMGKPLSA